jgi:hypothetical protein
VQRRTLRPSARRLARLRTGSQGVATRMRLARGAAGRRCAARGGRYQVAVSFAGAGPARAVTGMELRRPRR